ncbi:hypothetical protein [Photobacterium halotolerans]|uniref:Uncharacterized protein n=1 Tax=Photobacterium halotolerans TaxID=265726 RepID=A0A7X4W956_9GAMM|nr:hypothetical protein [Photobacterium halotolerans]NAW64388.1 hypothetical protein [Photobacterium halotolerans]
MPKNVLSNNDSKTKVTHSPREKFKTNFQIVGAGSAYNRIGRSEQPVGGLVNVSIKVIVLIKARICSSPCVIAEQFGFL